ncbi:MAG TPA: glycosyltransferase family 39 protein [Thermomicrobiales bacterium]|nr:glycosyltransferase family 39 protein [Thermomicrobiales bacterium]
MALALAVGLVLRCWNLGGVPPALNQDEAVNGYDAYSLFLTGRDHLGHPFPIAGLESFGDWVSPLLTFLTAPAVGLFGLRVETVRAVAAALGALTIPAVYLLAVELFGRRLTGVLAAWLVALLPWAIHLSRWAIPPATVPPLVALTLFALARAAYRRGARGVVAAGLVAGLAVLGYPTMKLYVPLLLLAALLVYGRDYLRVGAEALAYAALVFLAVAGPNLYLSLRDPGGRARFDQVALFATGHAGLGDALRQYASYFAPRFLFVAGDGDPMHAPPGFGVLPPALLPLLLAGLAWLVAEVAFPSVPGRRRSALFLLAAVALYPVPGALTVSSPHALRAASLIPLAAVVAAAGAVAVLDLAHSLLRAARPVLLRGALALLIALGGVPLGLELARQYANYARDYPREVAPLFQYGLAQMVAYARAHEGEYDEIWFSGASAPYIYVLFYDRWPPSDAHASLVVRRAPPRFNRVDALGKYHFGEPADLGGRQLPVLYTVDEPAGGIAFAARGGPTPAHGRVLFIYRP